jgi:hypothetical protein
MSQLHRSHRLRLTANAAGQATVELALASVLLLIFMCSAIDFGRALNDMQILSELTRQGSNLASRGTTLPNTATALINGDSGIGLSTSGQVFVTSFTQSAPSAGGMYTVTGQSASTPPSGFSQKSRVAPGGTIGSKFQILEAPALQAGVSLYVTEIFYTFTPLTGVGALTNGAVGFPSVLYDVAYF